MTKVRFDGDIIITDPCYIMDPTIWSGSSDWNRCNYGGNLEILGIKTHLTRDTIYGDWSCTTFQLKEPLQDRSPLNLLSEDFKEEDLGEFCADAGMVSVLLLEEVLNYNPDFDYHVDRPWTTTLIKYFHGEVEDLVIGENLFLVGTGNINFITRQTGF